MYIVGVLVCLFIVLLGGSFQGYQGAIIGLLIFILAILILPKACA